MHAEADYERPLGMRPPEDKRHVTAYPFGAVAAEVADLSPSQVDKALRVGKSLELPPWYLQGTHNQGNRRGSCVGHTTALERAVTNRLQRRAQGKKRITVRYSPQFHWRLAKDRDEWADTRPEDDDGTSARAAYDVLREVGPQPVQRMQYDPEHDGFVVEVGAGDADPAEGVVEVNRWCETSDEMRLAVASGFALPIGIPWMTRFDAPKLTEKRDGRRTIHMMPSTMAQAGRLRGYHEVLVFGASDRHQAFRIANSWGTYWPLTTGYLPYSLMDEMFDSFYADCCAVTDR